MNKRCKHCNGEISYHFAKNIKFWLRGIPMIGAGLLTVFLIIWFKLVGLIVAIVIGYLSTSWYHANLDLIPKCNQCGRIG